MNNCYTCKDDGGPCAKCGWKVFKGVSYWPTGHKNAHTGQGTFIERAAGAMVETVQKVTPQFSGATFKTCDHRGTEVVYKIKGGKCLYAAQGHRLAETWAKVDHLDLILDLAGLVRPRRFITAGSKRYQSLNTWAYPDVVNLHWPDMTAPKGVRLVFWQHLLATLPLHTAICCVGSHGRTGTCLAALMVADGVEPEKAIKLVRERHCSKAIESIEQENYIKGLRSA